MRQGAQAFRRLSGALSMLRRIIQACRNWAPVLRDTDGAAAIFFAVGIVPLIGGVGLAVDSSLGYVLRNRMAKSLDAAGLAAARAGEPEAETVERAFFDANFAVEDASGKNKSTATITLTRFAVVSDPATRRMTLLAEATAPTVFMRVFGHEKMSVSARSVVQRQNSGAELALVIDNAGSRSGSEMQAMREAAGALVDVLIGGAESRENLWISLVPYTATVNIGPQHARWLKPDDRVHADPKSFRKPGWKGCVEARPAPEDAGDAPPSVVPLTSFFYMPTKRKEDNKWPPLDDERSDGTGGSGPNLGCGSAITPLSASKATIKAALDRMEPRQRGGHAGNLGLAWGWRTLSPRWRGLWGAETPATLPLDYGNPLTKKIVVILTDGNNGFYDHDTASGTPGSDYTAYGRLEELGVTTLKQGRRVLDERLAGTCKAMKAEGIEIHAIVFGSEPDGQTQALYQECATSPAMYHRATDGAALHAAFTTVGAELSSLRIVE